MSELRYLDLKTGASGPASELPRRGRLAIAVLSHGDLQTAGQVLGTLVEGRVEDSWNNIETGIPPSDHSYWVLDETNPARIDQVVRYVCLHQTVRADALLLVNARTFRTLLDSRDLSHVVVDEYLLWSAEDLPEADGDARFWRGSGWLAGRFGRFLRDGQTIPTDFGALFGKIDFNATTLARRHLLETDRLDPEEIEQGRRAIAIAIAAYLPPVWHPVVKEWRHYSAYDLGGGGHTWGGPMPWLGIRDNRLSDLEMDLILDGWITPWQDADERWWCQPGSLTLLYWAARLLSLPYCGSADEFFQHHRWQKWFGGDLSRTEQPKA